MTASLDSTPISQGDARAITDALFQLSTSLDGFTAQVRRSLKLNAHERLAVAVLWARGPMTMTDLGAWIPLSRAAVTTLVDRLEDAGLVRRGADPADRRRTVVEVSMASLDRLIPVIEPWSVDTTALIDGLEPSEWVVVSNFLASLMRVSDEHAAKLQELSDEQLQQLVESQIGSEGSRP